MYRRCIFSNSATKVVLTKLDVLSNFEKINICVGYTHFATNKKLDFTTDLNVMEEIICEYIELDGWMCDISNIKVWEDFPDNFKKYVNAIEKYIEYPIDMISVGCERDKIIKL